MSIDIAFTPRTLSTSDSLRTFRLRRVLPPGSFKADSFKSSRQEKGGNDASGMD